MVNQLIIVDIAPKLYKRGHDDVLKALQEVQLEGMQSRKEVESALMPYLPDFGVRQFIMKNLDRNDAGAYSWKMNVPVLLRDYNQVVQAIAPNRQFLGDTLFIRGGNSIYIQDSDSQQMKELFPRYSLETIENAGHWVHADQPVLLMNLVLNFLKRR
jgi:pimeloyl-ACP methyl ester carboxylesterase